MQKEELRFIQQLIATSTSLPLLHIINDAPEGFSQSFTHYKALCSTGMIYTVITPMHLYFSCLCISKEEDEHFVLGPFLDHELSNHIIYSAGEKLNLTIEHMSRFMLYYQALPIMDASNATDILQLLRTRFMDSCYTNQPKLLDLRTDEADPTSYELAKEEIERGVTYKAIEQRYEIEDSMLQAISDGNLEKAQSYWNALSSLTKSLVRTKDSLRNKKNMLLIGNTLCRKAAQEGGVHPFYLDELSTKWALRIEQVTAADTLDNMQPQLIRSYCILVKNQSLAQFSPIVKKAITFIKLNLATSLTVTMVAQEVGVTPDYLTRLFKKELDSPVIAFINRKRIQASLKLLNTSDLPIQNIGDMVGLPDPCYFNKLFKKHIGVSPKQYRESLK